MSYPSQILTKTSQVCFARLQKERYSEVEWFYEDLHGLLELRPKKDILFIIGDWNIKVENQDISGVSGKFGLAAQMKQGKGYQNFAREYTSHSKQPFLITQEMTLHMDITR